MSTRQLSDPQQATRDDRNGAMAAPQPAAMSPAAALTAYLHQVRRRVGEIWTAPSQTPPALVQIPDFDQLVAAAGQVDSASPDTAAYIASVVMGLLGRAAAVDCESPPPTTPVFPADHRLHLSMGAEWYWIGAHVDVVNDADPTDTGRIAVLYSIQRQRAVGMTVQALAGWDDTDAQIASAVGTVTVDTTKQTSYVRRLPNIQWTVAGGSAAFSVENEPLLFQCGPDFISGSVDVLPLQMLVDDGQTTLDLTLSNSRMAPGDAFFLQGGTPVPGVTPLPTPGIYYSWPQLDVAGTIRVGGENYTVTGGSGWLDHQLMAASLENSDNAATPVPFIDDPKPFNGWSWQYYNLKNGDAFTLASFQHGELNPVPPVIYGYYLTPDPTGKKWIPSYLVGVMALEDFQAYDVNAGGGPPSQGTGTVSIPTSWSYLLGTAGDAPVKVGLIAQTRKWSDDGTFNNANGGIASELPVDLVDLSVGAPGGGGFGSGVGFGESISFEPVAQYHARALAYLASVGKNGLAGSIQDGETTPSAASLLEPDSNTLPAIVLPADQYGHVGAPTEWWWHVGTLQTADGREFGFEVNACGVLDAMVFTEIAIADVDKQIHYQIVNDQAYDEAWAETDLTKPWYVRITGPDGDPGNGAVSMTAIDGNPLNMAVNATFTDAAKGTSCRIDLNLLQQGPPLLVWGTGCQVLVPGIDPIKGNNYYYSLTNLQASGSITIGTEVFEVTGLTWMDHEYGAFPDPGPGQKNVWTLQDMQLSNGLHLSNYTKFGVAPCDGVAMPSTATLLLPGGESWFVETTTTPSDAMSINGTTYFATYTIRMRTLGRSHIQFVVRNICPNQVFVDPMKFNSGYEGVAEADMFLAVEVAPKYWVELNVSSGTAWIEQSL